MKLFLIAYEFFMSFNDIVGLTIVPMTMTQLARKPGPATEIDNPPRSEYA